MRNREKWVADTLVELADTLVPAFDPENYWLCVADRYQQLVPLSSISLVADSRQAAQPIVVNTDERLGTPEMTGLLAEEGPGIDCRTGGHIVNVRLDDVPVRWEKLVPAALSLGYLSVHAFPIRRRLDVLGTVTILTTGTVHLPTADVLIADALADVAATAMLNHHAITELTRTTTQLQGALSSRVIIEQAKGLVSARLEIDPSAAFLLLRRYARGHNQRIGALCEQLVARRMTVSELVAAVPKHVTGQGRRR
ncbi:ANTAR domain-containing protein [Amycolatopsis alba]|uniref:ANTAR domain-containing protein n=1 Tax=Amycolatopsis alba DSM 44262 TaxID=1125972 RepID=A0A229RHZ9_AMYAL|nr:ANTAR domain-containing protein [Amycolatopsis alba]OXM46273.1 ANTAR domain-containing protein [Amycolatopsis alba DSM 44262]